jgi:hypothetical protein
MVELWQAWLEDEIDDADETGSGRVGEHAYARIVSLFERAVVDYISPFPPPSLLLPPYQRVC